MQSPPSAGAGRRTSRQTWESDDSQAPFAAAAAPPLGPRAAAANPSAVTASAAGHPRGHRPFHHHYQQQQHDHHHQQQQQQEQQEQQQQVQRLKSTQQQQPHQHHAATAVRSSGSSGSSSGSSTNNTNNNSSNRRTTLIGPSSVRSRPGAAHLEGGGSPPGSTAVAAAVAAKAAAAAPPDPHPSAPPWPPQLFPLTGSSCCDVQPSHTSSYSSGFAAITATPPSSTLGQMPWSSARSLARSSSPGGPPDGHQHPPHLLQPHHSASAGGAPPANGGSLLDLAVEAANPTLPQPPLMLMPSPAGSVAGPYCSNRPASDDVEAATHDQATSGCCYPPISAAAAAAAAHSRGSSSGGSSGDSDSGSSSSGCSTSGCYAKVQPQPPRPDGFGAASAGGALEAAEAALTATPGGAAAAAARPETLAPGAASALVGNPSRRQLTVSVFPSLRTPAAAEPPLGDLGGGGGGSAAAITLGVPMVLTRASSADAAGMVPGGRMAVCRSAESAAAMGTPAAAQHHAAAAAAIAAAAAAGEAAAGAGDGVFMVSEDGLERFDVVASISIAAAGDRMMRRGGEGDEAVGAAAADDEADPCALPPDVRRRLRSHLGRHGMKSIRTWKDLSHCMSSTRPNYWLMTTLLLLSVMLSAFMFMAGQYDFIRPIDISAGPSKVMGLEADPLTSYSWGPHSLASWLTFWKARPETTFNFDYLRLWGGRYAPDLAAGQWWRWVTSLLLHQSSLHLASNLALLLVLSMYLESLFGFWRVLPTWIVAGVAGNMVSAWLESPCTLVVGSSGAVFGLLGVYVADASLNFESIPLLWLRLLGMATVVALIVALQVTDHGGDHSRSSTSHASHAGGFVTGLMLALILVPDFKARRCKKVKKLLSGLGLGGRVPHPATPGGRQLFSFWQRHAVIMIALYVVAGVLLALVLLGLPLYLYLHTFKRMACG